MRLLHPARHIVQRGIGVQRTGEDAGVRGDPDECQNHQPRNRDRRGSGKHLLQPGPRRIVVRRGAVDGVDQQIGVGQQLGASKHHPEKFVGFDRSQLMKAAHDDRTE